MNWHSTSTRNMEGNNTKRRKEIGKVQNRQWNHQKQLSEHSSKKSAKRIPTRQTPKVQRSEVHPVQVSHSGKEEIKRTQIQRIVMQTQV